MNKHMLLAVALVPICAYAGSESSTPRCEDQTAALMTTDSSWAQLASAGAVLPPQCFDGYFAEGISDTLVRKMASDWDGFVAVLDEKSSDGPFINLVLRSINESVDPQDVDVVTASAKDRCPRRHGEVCSAIIGRAGALEW